MIRASLFALTVAWTWWTATGEVWVAFSIAATGFASALVAWLARGEVRRA